MTDFANRALLPAGLRDILPPDAAFEADVAHSLMGVFAAHAYERVEPPLVEFEDSLLAGSGADMAAETFRLLDPLSHRMMAVRADITLQVARIATTRLAAVPRPLRLSYAGQVLRVTGTQLRPQRQFAQAGVELIGSDSPAADAEVIVLVVEALAALGVADISVDLTLPQLVPALFDGLGVEPCDRARLREALNHRDAATVAAVGGPIAAVLGALLDAAGPADRALHALATLTLPPAAAAARDQLAAVVALVKAGVPGLVLTVDPVENRGFAYHTGVGFTVFSRHSPDELGRGGRYLAGNGEPATGATVFMDSVLGIVPRPDPARRLYVPLGTPAAQAAAQRANGWVTVCGLVPNDTMVETVRLACEAALVDGKITFPN